MKLMFILNILEGWREEVSFGYSVFPNLLFFFSFLSYPKYLDIDTGFNQ